MTRDIHLGAQNYEMTYEMSHVTLALTSAWPACRTID